jgi:hypothetical protein
MMSRVFLSVTVLATARLKIVNAWSSLEPALAKGRTLELRSTPPPSFRQKGMSRRQVSSGALPEPGDDEAITLSSLLRSPQQVPGTTSERRSVATTRPANPVNADAVRWRGLVSIRRRGMVGIHAMRRREFLKSCRDAVASSSAAALGTLLLGGAGLARAAPAETAAKLEPEKKGGALKTLQQRSFVKAMNSEVGRTDFVIFIALKKKNFAGACGAN